MAILLEDRPKNLTEYPNSFKRQGAFPLESTSCWYSLDSAKDYAKNNLTAYVGQLITVIENDSVKHYTIISTKGDLQEIGVGLTFETIDCGSATDLVDYEVAE